jgi:hypothetical protein
MLEPENQAGDSGPTVSLYPIRREVASRVGGLRWSTGEGR